MTSRQRRSLSYAVAVLLVATATTASAQTFEFVSRDTSTGSIVRDAPYAGEGVTTMLSKSS